MNRVLVKTLKGIRSTKPWSMVNIGPAPLTPLELASSVKLTKPLVQDH
jgi:hypothetical protein